MIFNFVTVLETLFSALLAGGAGLLLTEDKAGPNPNVCSWTYANHGYQLECGRNDEIVAGRCGSGEHNDCPNGSSHGILCCEFTVYEIKNKHFKS